MTDRIWHDDGALSIRVDAETLKTAISKLDALAAELRLDLVEHPEMADAIAPMLRAIERTMNGGRACSEEW